MLYIVIQCYVIHNRTILTNIFVFIICYIQTIHCFVIHSTIFFHNVCEGEVKENGHDHSWPERSVGALLGYVATATNDIFSQQSIDHHQGWGAGGRVGAGSPVKRKPPLAAPSLYMISECFTEINIATFPIILNNRPNI